MKKQLIIVGIIILLVCVGLSGCNNTTVPDEEKIIGTWTNKALFEGSIRSFSYNFYTNKSFKYLASYENEDYRVNGTWNITDNKLIMTSELETKTFDYKISDKDKTLTLTSESGNSVKYIRE